MLFCDNTFAMPFAAIKLAGKSYNVGQLMEYMNDSNTRCGFGQTAEERELSYYNWSKNKSNINLNSYGWYLAHIIPVGTDFNGKSLSHIFINPDRAEWDLVSKLRNPANNLTAGELAVMGAHFLRLVHPLNSFVVPKRDILLYNGKNIGEELQLINIVQNYIKQVFPDEYCSLEELMQIPAEKKCNNDKISEIIWDATGKSIRSGKTNIKTLEKHPTIQMNTKPVVDIFDRDENEVLDNTLKSIGKATFLKLYPLVLKNPDISVEQVCIHFPQYLLYSTTSQRTRLSSTKSILSQNLGREALYNIVLSANLSQENRTLATQYLDLS